MTRPRSGLILLRKPKGITSFQALGPIKKAMASSKVGHAGTLDRFACGLLVVLTGSYSRLSSYAMSGEKHYRGLVAFGAETDTLDPEGETVAEAPIPTRSALEAALTAFRGIILQKPPLYSAVHVDGKRAYERALKGEAPELKARPVEIRSLELASYDEGKAILDVRCSSGTYIRSLARDIALACGSRAHLEELERLSIGPFSVTDSVAPDAFAPESHLREITAEDAIALCLQTLELRDPAMVQRFLNGGRIPAAAFSGANQDFSPDADSAVFDGGGRLLGIIGLEAEGPRYKAVMPRE